MRVVLFQRGHVMWGFQIGRLYLYWPRWSFMRCGVWPQVGWDRSE